MAETQPVELTYYGLPALKPTEWRWLVISYLFMGGMAGAAQVIAGVLDLIGNRRDRRLISAARYLAFAGALISPALLIADLKTPSRWYNMLRIARPTSPMSIGSWGLAIFGMSSGLTTLGQIGADLLEWRSARTLARWAGVAAAAAGALVATYTGSLLAATSTPMWAATHRLLPSAFGVSGVATATAALSLVLDAMSATADSRQRLERLALLSNLLDLVLTLRVDAVWKREQLAGPVEETRLVWPYRVGVFGLGIFVPLVVHLLQLVTGRELRVAARFASMATLVGGYTHRAVLLFAGKASAQRPTDYFRLARS